MDRRWLLGLFLVALVVRLAWIALRYLPEGRWAILQYPDEEAYAGLARSLREGDGLIDEFGYRATYMPGYPAFLALVSGLPRWLLWARGGQALLAAWIAPATYLLARAWLATAGNDRPAGGAGTSTEAEAVVQSPQAASASTHHSRFAVWLPVLAGLAAAFDPFLLFFSGLLLTEALFATCVVMAWVYVMRLTCNRRGDTAGSLQAGLWLLAAVMLRPSAAILVGFTLAGLILAGRVSSTAWKRSAMVGLVVLAGLAPWAARNSSVIGQWRWLTTRGGISLYDGLRPGTAGESDLAHTKQMAEVQGLNEVEWDAWFRGQAVAYAREHPGQALRLAGQKFLRTWSLKPNVASYSSGPVAWVSAAWMAVLLTTAAIGLWAHRRALVANLMLLLPVITFTAIHMVFVGSVRYRVPTMPMLMVLSAAGVIYLLETLRRRA